MILQNLKSKQEEFETRRGLRCNMDSLNLLSGLEEQLAKWEKIKDDPNVKRNIDSTLTNSGREINFDNWVKAGIELLDKHGGALEKWV